LVTSGWTKGIRAVRGSCLVRWSEARGVVQKESKGRSTGGLCTKTEEEERKEMGVGSGTWVRSRGVQSSVGLVVH
jgi:hypothetical protein